MRLPFILLLVAATRLTLAQAPVSARRQYDAYVGELKKALLAGDADALGDLVTADRVSVTGVNGRTVRGRDAQVQSDRALFESSRVVAFEMNVTDFRGSDSLAYAAGTGVHTVVDRATGTRRVDRMQYVDVLVLEADGHWRSRYFMNAPIEPAK